MTSLRIPDDHVKGVLKDYKIELKMFVRLPIDGDEQDYINPIYGNILYFNERKCDYEPCGKLECQFVNIERVLTDGYGYYEILDAYSSELSEVADIFNERRNEKTGRLKRKTVTALGYKDYDAPWNENIIYIRKLEVIKKHRGKGVGIEVLRETLSYLSQNFNFAFYVIIPCPLQTQLGCEQNSKKVEKWNKAMAYDEMEKNRSKATKRLRDLYSELGFTLIKGTRLMVCSADEFEDF